ncbi:MAG: metallophosphoesterase [Limosilactobacillus coleohominis]|uniref:metallophosphoesterase n=1 Tax=Limosilactobacillus coleohominis TaxID=181675 RepID=UPI002A809951|nr:metallophosphoesterase [Limosilactobacillus coleohominis]MCI5812822.1 metallophosphoesterase [Lactobacillus sp.]MDY3702202.1 metallophosphoesterase [Limosilactobacillus coleohominis]MDY5629132.1 metallophosphoesterase [Limosilactobacillus coleohominis]
MKILLVSDNHGDVQILKSIDAAFKLKVDQLFHCGDSNLSFSISPMRDFQTVLGNTDQKLDYPKVITQKIDNQNVTVTHGHLFQVGMTMTPLLLLAKETKADIVAYGHTHQLAVAMDDNCLFINPGSISYPRGEYAKIGGTFAVVDATQEHFDVQYFDRNLQPIPELKFGFARAHE